MRFDGATPIFSTLFTFLVMNFGRRRDVVSLIGDGLQVKNVVFIRFSPHSQEDLKALTILNTEGVEVTSSQFRAVVESRVSTVLCPHRKSS